VTGGLWAVHTLGMDDLHPCASRVLAVRNATWMNLSLERALEDMGDESYPLIYNVPVLWDGNEAGHAEALAASVAEDSRWSGLSADVIGDLARGVYANPVAATEAEAVPPKASPVDRETAAGMTVREACQKLTEAYAGDRQTADEAAELDHAESLIDALDEELRELRGGVATEDTSDGYHTFKELYEYRLLYNAALFNEWATFDRFDALESFGVHKSRRHSDGELTFGGGWFVVVAQLPTGQISNHYPEEAWGLFRIPERETAAVWDGHTPADVAERLRAFLTGGSGQ
jgi:hypothetical protein